jgi:hypothetical protein
LRQRDGRHGNLALKYALARCRELFPPDLVVPPAAAG